MRLRSIAALAVTSLLATTVSIRAASLNVGPGRPGPSVLYAPVAQAPQFRSSGSWSAPPILVSGASSYRSGEYVYQDFLYDDHGANAPVPDPNDVRAANATFSRPAGTYTYPTDPRYAGNAADLVEFRMKLATGGTLFRVTYNTMIDPSLAAFTIALGGASGSAFAMPHGADTIAPGDVFLTWHGSTFDVVRGATGAVVYSGTPNVITANRQVEIFLPSGVYATAGNHALRVAIATGLWNLATNTYLVPSATSSIATAGGGGGLVAPSAFFNVGFRHAEPAQGALNVPLFPSNATASAQWRELAQSRALAAGDITPFADIVDTVKLASRVNDDMNALPQGVPTSGSIARILASHFEPAQGADLSNKMEGALGADPPQYLGNLQPYSIYIPKSHVAGAPYPMTVLLHALYNNYNEFTNTAHQSEFASRGPGALVVTPEARGPGGWYYGLSEADVFETWADVAAHYPLDPNATTISGYSMGSFGAYKLAVEYPDLFARVATTVAPIYTGLGAGSGQPTVQQMGTLVTPYFTSLRNVPVFAWVAAADELEPPSVTINAQRALDALGYRYEFDLFNAGDHLFFANNDEYGPMAQFLGTSRSVADPAHVTYSIDPARDFAAYGTVADHAYWVSGLTIRAYPTTTVATNPGAGPIGTIDARSEGFGTLDPVPAATVTAPGTLAGGKVAPLVTYTGFSKTWAPALAAPARDIIHVVATNIATVTIDPKRAHADCQAVLDVNSDGPITIALAGCDRKATFAARRRPLDRSTPGFGNRRLQTPPSTSRF